MKEKKNEYKIAVIKGDGIGPEIIDEALKVLTCAAECRGFSLSFNFCSLGGCAYDECGSPLPEDTVLRCKDSDAVLLGAVGGYKWDSLPSNLRPEAGLLGIRKALGLYANLRHVKLFDALSGASTLKAEVIQGLDIMVVRELTGGIYFAQHGRDAEGAFDTEYYHKYEIERIAKTAFELAMKRNKKLCSVDKANVLESSRLWREIVNTVAADYPEVELTHMYVDNCAMQLIRRPLQFDVIVTSNMFGDILSDEASVLGGSIGMLASASLAQGDFGLFEPIHGSAPDIAGQNTANPLAAILSCAMLLRYSFGEGSAADLIEAAVEKTLESYRTADIYEEGYKKVSCSEMGDLVAEKIKSS